MADKEIDPTAFGTENVLRRMLEVEEMLSAYIGGDDERFNALGDAALTLRCAIAELQDTHVARYYVGSGFQEQQKQGGGDGVHR